MQFPIRMGFSLDDSGFFVCTQINTLIGRPK